MLATGAAQLDDVDLSAPAARPAALDASCTDVLARQVTIDAASPHAVRAACTVTGQAARRACATPPPEGRRPGDGQRPRDRRRPPSASTPTTGRDRDGPPRAGCAAWSTPGDPPPLADVRAVRGRRRRPADDRRRRRRHRAARRRRLRAPARAGRRCRPATCSSTRAPRTRPDPGGAAARLVGHVRRPPRYGDPSLPGRRRRGGAGRRTRPSSPRPARESADLLQRIDLSTCGTVAIDGGGASALAARAARRLRRRRRRRARHAPRSAIRRARPRPSSQLGPSRPPSAATPRTCCCARRPGAIPVRTRAIDVTLHGERRAGTYTDAYGKRWNARTRRARPCSRRTPRSAACSSARRSRRC